MLSLRAVSAQSFQLTTKQQDFEPIERFFAIADSIKNNQVISARQWSSYFQIPVIKLFSQDPNLDSAKYVNDMRLIYGDFDKYISNKNELSSNQKLLVDFMQNKKLIKSTIAKMNTQNVNDSIKRLLFPVLPQRLRNDSVLPKQIYMYLTESTAMGGYGFNSMLQTAELNNYKCGIIAAHESYHSIGAKQLLSLCKSEMINKNAPEPYLLSVLERYAEEGIADLIDKDILGKSNSPWYREVHELIKDDNILAPFYMHRLDSLFKNAYRTKKMEMFNWSDLSQNGGHIPGRFMGLAIRDAGLLSQCQEHIGDPVSFFEFYNRAAEKNKSLPVFSEESILYLQQIRKECFN